MFSRIARRSLNIAEAIPVPATAALLFAGLLGMGGLASRRHRLQTSAPALAGCPNSFPLPSQSFLPLFFPNPKDR
jgi:hypothetical protein